MFVNPGNIAAREYRRTYWYVRRIFCCNLMEVYLEGSQFGALLSFVHKYIV